MRKRIGLLGLSGLLALALTACAQPSASPPVATPTASVGPAAAIVPTTASTPPSTASPSPESASNETTLTFGTSQALSESGVFVAIAKGYFAEQGINLKVVNFSNVAEMIGPIGTGQLDVVSSPLSAPLLKAADRGIDLKIVSGAGVHQPNWEYGWIVLRKDLQDSGSVKTPADLKGMKVATPSLGALGEESLDMMLDQAGMKPSDVDMEVLPFPEQAVAFGNKAIAASFTVEPFIARGVQQDFSVKWIPLYKLFGGNLDGAVMLFGSKLLKDQDLGRRWMIAYLKGVRDYLKAFTTKEGQQEIIDILAKYTTVTDPKLYSLMEMPYEHANGGLDKASIETQYKWYVDKGLYTGEKTVDDMIDPSFAEYASQKLGRQ